MSIHDEKQVPETECEFGYAGCTACHHPEQEKPTPPADDVVERCAQAIADQEYHAGFYQLVEGQKNFLRNQARAVLNAAGFGYWRERALSAEASLLRARYDKKEVERLREERDAGRAVCLEQRQKIEELTGYARRERERAESAEKESAELESENERLRKVIEEQKDSVRFLSRTLGTENARHTELAKLARAACEEHYACEGESAIRALWYALDSAQSKDSGQPAGTPSPGLHREGGYAEPAGCSSPPADDPTLDATDGAHPAWWRGHDRAEQEFRRREESDERRHREMLIAVYEAARLRDPSERGPATGEGITPAEFVRRVKELAK